MCLMWNDPCEFRTNNPHCQKEVRGRQTTGLECLSTAGGLELSLDRMSIASASFIANAPG